MSHELWIIMPIYHLYCKNKIIINYYLDIFVVYNKVYNVVLANNQLRSQPINYQITAANQNWVNLLVQQSEGPFHQQTLVSLSFATHLHFSLLRFFSRSLSSARIGAKNAEFRKYEHSYKSIKPTDLEFFLIFRNFHDFLHVTLCREISRGNWLW